MFRLHSIAQTNATMDTVFFSYDGNIPLAYNFFDDTCTIFPICTKVKHNTEDLLLTYTIKKNNAKGIKTVALSSWSKNIPKTETTAFYYFPINDSFINNGNYIVEAKLSSLQKNILSTKQLLFQILRKKNDKYRGEPQRVLDYTNKDSIENTFVAKYTMQQLQRNIKALQPISSSIEDKVIQRIGDYDSIFFLRQFFYNFWKNRNETQPEKEWLNYTLKLNYVAEKYNRSTLLGYETDRGKIYLRYGEPNSIDKVNSEKNAQPYEIWHYTMLENKYNVSFLFYQSGIKSSELQILTSTLTDLYYNPYWARLLFTDGSTSTNDNNHRAFEYFK